MLLEIGEQFLFLQIGWTDSLTTALNIWSTHHKEAELMGVYIHVSPLLWHTDQQLQAQ